MRKRLAPFAFALLLAASLPAVAESLPAPSAASSAADEAASKRDASYREGRRALDDSRWNDAIRHFGKVIEGDGKDADGALYWKAYAHQKAGERAEALAAIAALESNHPRSKWRNDARALRLEVRGGEATNPALDDDDELKLLALNSLMGMEPERAVELLESFLAGNRSPKLRERALFILSQNPSDRALEILVEAARGAQGEDLRKVAIRQLGLSGGRASAQLEEIYRSAADAETKTSVLEAYMLSGAAEKVIAAYRTEEDPQLRQAAVRQLGIMGAQKELRELYRSESAKQVRGQILKALFIASDDEALMEIYRVETDSELKQKAIKNLGLTHSDEGRAFLVEVYRSEMEKETKVSVLHALFLSQASEELVEIARGERDPELRLQAIHNLGLTHSEDGRDYLVELYGSDTHTEVKEGILKALFLSQADTELIKIARNESDPELKKAAIRNLAMIRSDEAAEFMIELLEGN